MWRRKTPCTLFVGMQYGALTMKNGMEGLQKKLKTELPMTQLHLKKLKTPI